jgi:glycosyltransferase involved in cell wall biosynthesis
MEIMIYQIIHNFTEGIGGAETLVSNLFVGGNDYLSNSNQSSKYEPAPKVKGENGNSQVNYPISIIGICNSTESTLGNRIGWGIANIYSLQAYFAVHQFIRNVEFKSIIHSHLFPTGFYVGIARWINRRNDIKHVFTEHSTQNKRRKHLLGKWIDRLMYNQIDSIICVSNGVKFELLKNYPFLIHKTRVIINGINLNSSTRLGGDPFSNIKKEPFGGDSDSSIESVADTYPFSNIKMESLNSDSSIESVADTHQKQPKPILRILTVGRLVTAKNYSMAISALSKLKYKGIPFKYTIAGSGENAGSGNLELELKQQVRSEHLEEEIIFLGQVNYLRPFFLNSDLYLAISLFEGFGLAALEAMSYGLPLIYSNVPGLKELIPNNYPQELIVSPHSQEQVLDALLFFEKSSLRNRIEFSELCRKKAEEFSIENTLQQHLLLYEELNL